MRMLLLNNAIVMTNNKKKIKKKNRTSTKMINRIKQSPEIVTFVVHFVSNTFIFKLISFSLQLNNIYGLFQIIFESSLQLNSIQGFFQIFLNIFNLFDANWLLKKKKRETNERKKRKEKKRN